MRSEFRQMFLALTLLSPIGCQKAEPEAQSLMHQVLGALQIPNKAERDSALAAACRECATAGDVESVLLGLPSITDKNRRDDVAVECVQMLVTANKQEVARKIVELISDPTKRARLSAVLTAH